MSNHSYFTGWERVTGTDSGGIYGGGERVQAALPHLLGEEGAARLAETFKALSDPTRLRIVSLLAGSELCVYDLAAILSMGQSAVSHQLRTLRDLRLVRRRREGRHIFYTLDDEHVADLFRRGLEHVEHG
jgi:DNA-binding transcriptional ArsR family regulator